VGFPRQLISRWAFDVEILKIARNLKYKIKEVPITWVNDGESHVKLAGEVNMLLELVEVRLNTWTGKYNNDK
jgi:hypothetical protein